MIVVLSPAKTLDMEPATVEATQPRLLNDSQELVDELRRRSPQELRRLMSISEPLATLNHARYRDFHTPFRPENAKPALLAFRGDVYLDLAAETFSERELDFANRHLRILSGLYGVLRPRDLMQAYRLEMGTRLPTPRGRNLYEFWDGRLTDLINEDLDADGGSLLLNLASKEYFASLHPERLRARVLNVHFRERREGKYRVIAYNAKRARGRMAGLIVREGITEAGPLRDLRVNDYVFRPELSSENDWFFVR